MTVAELRAVDWETTDFTMDKASAILGAVDWQHADRPFTDDELMAIAYVTHLYDIGRLTPKEFGQLFGGIDPMLIPPVVS